MELPGKFKKYAAPVGGFVALGLFMYGLSQEPPSTDNAGQGISIAVTQTAAQELQGIIDIYNKYNALLPEAERGNVFSYKAAHAPGDNSERSVFIDTHNPSARELSYLKNDAEYLSRYFASMHDERVSPGRTRTFTDEQVARFTRIEMLEAASVRSRLDNWKLKNLSGRMVLNSGNLVPSQS